MNKRTFLWKLRRGLKGLSKQEREERLTFLGEMIDDRMEEGLSEEEAVRSVGPMEEILRESLPENGDQTAEGRRKAWEIVLLILGSPVWLSVLIAAFAVAVSLFAVLWAVIFSLWAVCICVPVCGAASLVYAGVNLIGEYSVTGLFLLGGGFFCLGASGFLYYACKYASKCAVLISRKTLSGVGKCFG